MKQFATTVILNQDASQTLLILREDFHIWGLAGGTIDPGETPEQAAVREALEETGFHGALERLAGIYLRPQMKDKRCVYIARISGGQAIDNGPETLAVRWFPVDQLPKKATPFLAEIIRDALASEDLPDEKIQLLLWGMPTLWRVRLWLRDLRNFLTGRR